MYVYICFVLIHQIAIQHRTLKTTTIIMTVKQRKKMMMKEKKATEKKVKNKHTTSVNFQMHTQDRIHYGKGDRETISKRKISHILGFLLYCLIHAFMDTI